MVYTGVALAPRSMAAPSTAPKIVPGALPAWLAAASTVKAARHRPTETSWIRCRGASASSTGAVSTSSPARPAGEGSLSCRPGRRGARARA